jgi:SH3 domain protein
MSMKATLRTLLLLLLLPAYAVIAVGAPAWVSDEFEITLRSGPSTGNAIQLMVSSGLRLEVLQRDTDSGYSRVRTPGGTEGWVLTRYLMDEASAREQLEKLTGELTNANTLGSSLDSQLVAIKSEYNSAQQKIARLERDKGSLEGELAEIKRTSANVLKIDARNTTLASSLTNAQIEVDGLKEQNRQLTSGTTRYWFMTGALVLLVGVILGVWLPRIRWQRRARYDRL